MWFWCFFPFLISRLYEKWWKYFCSPEEKSENWSGSLGMRARVKLGIFGFFPMTRICAWKSRQNIPNVLYFIRTEGVLVHASTSSIKMKLSFHSLLLLRSTNFTLWLVFRRRKIIAVVIFNLRVCAKGAFFIPFRHSPILSASYIYSLCLFLGISHSSSAFHFTMRSNRVYIKPMCTCSVSGLVFILRDLRNKANKHKHTSVFQHNETQCMQLVFPERIFPFSIPLGAFILSLFLFYLVKTLSFFWQLFTYFICMIPLPLSV